MPMPIVLSLVAPQACVAVKQQCRACTTTGGKMACSTPGIACQPFQRICPTSRDGKPASTRQSSPSAKH
jgi:hypothetical protein